MTLIAQNRRALHTLLFEAAAATLLEFGQNKFGVRLGITAVLHTWSQTLLDHLATRTTPRGHSAKS